MNRNLFADAPIQQAAPTLPTQMPGSRLAGAFAPVNLPPPNFLGKGDPYSFGMAAPLASLMKQNAGSGTQPIWNPNNPVGTDTLGGNTANQGGPISNWLAANVPGYHGGPPSGATPPQPPADGGAYQPQPGDAALMQTMQSVGALAPQYHAPPPPSGFQGQAAPPPVGGPGMPMPGMQGPGMPTPGQPGAYGLMGQALSGQMPGGL